MNTWLEYCVRKARARETPQRYRLHAVLVKGGSVQAEGENLSVEDAHGRTMNPNAEEWMGLHAEMACLKNATDEQIRGSVLYVAGVNPSGEVLVSEPCEYCREVISEQPLKALAYVVINPVSGKHVDTRLTKTAKGWRWLGDD